MYSASANGPRPRRARQHEGAPLIGNVARRMRQAVPAHVGREHHTRAVVVVAEGGVTLNGRRHGTPNA